MNILEHRNMRTLVFRMGLPAMLGMLVIALYNVVDTFFISGLGIEAVAAASVIFPISMLVSGVAFAFGTGAAAAVSQLLGSREHQRARVIANTSFFSAIGVAAVLSLAIGIFSDQVFSLFGADASVMGYARSYGLIILFGAVINVGTVTANNLIRSEGFAKTSMITMSLGAVMNMLLDPLLIYSFGMGIEGAAVATVLAQAAALCYILNRYRKADSVVKVSLRYFRPQRAIYRKVLSIGIPVLVYQGLSSISVGIINSQAASYGPQAVAAMGIVTKILTLMSYVVFGFVKGLQPIAGYCYGAGQYDRLQAAISKTGRILTCYCIAAAAAVIVLAPSIIALFTDAPAASSLAVRTLRWWSASFLFLGYQMTCVTGFLAIGRAKEGSILGLSRQGLILIPLIFLLRAIFGLEGIILAQPAADLLTFLLVLIYAPKLKGIGKRPKNQQKGSLQASA